MCGILPSPHKPLLLTGCVKEPSILSKHDKSEGGEASQVLSDDHFIGVVSCCGEKIHQEVHGVRSIHSDGAVTIGVSRDLKEHLIVRSMHVGDSPGVIFSELTDESSRGLSFLKFSHL